MRSLNAISFNFYLPRSSLLCWKFRCIMLRTENIFKRRRHTLWPPVQAEAGAICDEHPEGKSFAVKASLESSGGILEVHPRGGNFSFSTTEFQSPKLHIHKFLCLSVVGSKHYILTFHSFSIDASLFLHGLCCAFPLALTILLSLFLLTYIFLALIYMTFRLICDHTT